MLIDTHCHLNFEAFKDDIAEVIERAKERGVGKIIIPGTDIATSEKAISIAQTYSNCWAAVGIHPHHSKDANLVVDDKLRHQLRQMLQQKRVVAAGEIGMDYHTYEKSKYGREAITDEIKDKQKELFTLQYTLAQELQKPMILHCREAHTDMIQTISKLSSPEAPTSHSISRTKVFTLSPAVFHCYGGSTKHLKLLTSMGFYVGYDGNITYSEDWKHFVSSTPLENILLETDSPYLTPQPHRGTRNEPQYLPLVAEAVARYKDVPLEEVIHISTQNAERLFGLH